MVLGLVILLVRRNVPESPRWLFIHGRDQEAEQLVTGIEQPGRGRDRAQLDEPRQSITIRQRKSIGFGTIAQTMFARYPRRTILGLSLFIGQAFLYNAITFGYAQILTVSSTSERPWRLLRGDRRGQPDRPARPGPPLRLRRPQADDRRHLHPSGVLLLVTAWLFAAGELDAVTLTACWSLVLFFASAGASCGVPDRERGLPDGDAGAGDRVLLRDRHRAAGSRPAAVLLAGQHGQGGDTAIAFVIGAGLMILAGLVEVFLGVKAERQSLEEIASPITAQDATAPSVASAA